MSDIASMQETRVQRSVRQLKVLSRRYGACFAGDWVTGALLFAQAPLIGWLCAVVWGGVERDTPSLHFVMALSAVWFGCINACREIVKERTIFERERLFGLSLPAYVGSKIAVLAGLGLAQTLALQMAGSGPSRFEVHSCCIRCPCGVHRSAAQDLAYSCLLSRPSRNALSALFRFCCCLKFSSLNLCCRKNTLVTSYQVSGI